MRKVCEKLWDPRGDGDCFFACMWGAFYLVLRGDPELADVHDQGVWGAVGAKRMRALLRDYMVRKLAEGEGTGKMIARTLRLSMDGTTKEPPPSQARNLP